MSRHDDGEKPQRSCLACRETRDRDRLIRFVLSPQGEVVPDLDVKLPGRGAYTCVSAACLAAAVWFGIRPNQAFARGEFDGSM